MNFRKVDSCLLDIIKPYQRSKLSQPEPMTRCATGALEQPNAPLGFGSGELLGHGFIYSAIIKLTVNSIATDSFVFTFAAMLNSVS